MLKRMKITLLGVLTLVGGLMYSCNKHQDPTVPVISNAKLTQNVNDELIESMAADQLVKDYILTDIAFANDYAVWYKNLPLSQQQERKNEINHAIETGNLISDPVHTSSEIDDFNTLQLSRANQIKEKYTTLATLNGDDYESVQSRLVTVVTSNVGSQELYFGSGCSYGYRACLNWCRQGGASGSAYGRCVNGCSAGYYACLAAETPRTN